MDHTARRYSTSPKVEDFAGKDTGKVGIMMNRRDLNQSIFADTRKLFDIGYTNVYEFGGIMTWTGEIVK